MLSSSLLAGCPAQACTVRKQQQSKVILEASYFHYVSFVRKSLLREYPQVLKEVLILRKDYAVQCVFKQDEINVIMTFQRLHPDVTILYKFTWE